MKRLHGASTSPVRLPGQALRRAGRVICGVAVLALAGGGCGGGEESGFGCGGSGTGRTCTASFYGTGSQDLSSQLGGGATVDLKEIRDRSVVVQVGGSKATLVPGRSAAVGRLELALRKVADDSATLTVMRRRAP